MDTQQTRGGGMGPRYHATQAYNMGHQVQTRKRIRDTVETRRTTTFLPYTTATCQVGKSFRIAGFRRADKATIQRLKQDGKRYAPYRYKPQTVLWNKEGQWRLPAVEEQEVHMGYPKGYTQDDNHRNDDHTREQLLANTMHIDSLKRILQDAPSTTNDTANTVPRYQGHHGTETATSPKDQAIVNSIEHVADMVEIDNHVKVENAEADSSAWREAIAQGKPDISDVPDYNAKHQAEETTIDKPPWPHDKIEKLKQHAIKSTAAQYAMKLICTCRMARVQKQTTLTTRPKSRPGQHARTGGQLPSMARKAAGHPGEKNGRN